MQQAAGLNLASNPNAQVPLLRARRRCAGPSAAQNGWFCSHHRPDTTQQGFVLGELSGTCTIPSLCHVHAITLGRNSKRCGCVLVRARSPRDDPDNDEEINGQGFGFTQRGKIISINLNGNRFSINKDSLWTLLVPAAGVLGLAMTIGPLIIGLVFAAAAVGALLSFGAFALSFLWIPFILAGVGTLVGGSLLFGGFASLGLGLLLPKLIGLAVVAAGMGLGALGTGWLVLSRGRPSGGKKGGREKSARAQAEEGPVVQAESRPIDESEEEVRRMARELREFDNLLAESEERARLEQWKERARGGR